jgi:hypothetical protein
MPQTPLAFLADAVRRFSGGRWIAATGGSTVTSLARDGPAAGAGPRPFEAAAERGPLLR